MQWKVACSLAVPGTGAIYGIPGDLEAGQVDCLELWRLDRRKEQVLINYILYNSHLNLQTEPRRGVPAVELACFW